MEAYYDAYAGFFGVDLPQGQRIEYHLFRSEDSLQAAFGCKCNACAKGTRIGAVYPFIAHELVHAVGDLQGSPPALFEEGLASVIGCADAPDASKIDKIVPLEDLVETQAFDAWFLEHGHAELYAASKSFVRYLLDRYGTKRFLAFRAVAARGSSRMEVAEVFQAAFEEPVEAAFAGWRAQPPRHHDDSCLRIAECGPAVPPLVSGDIRLGCGTNGGESLAREALLPRSDISRQDPPHLHPAGVHRDGCELALRGPPMRRRSGLWQGRAHRVVHRRRRHPEVRP